MNRIVILLLFSCIANSVAAQRTTVEEYIEQFKEIAINEMKRSGVPASITLAQGILESESGNSELVKKSNNHFGIKCKSNWSGESVTHDDDATGECFRAYTNAGDSYRDHSDFLKANKRYGSLFGLDPEDYEGWAYGLKKAGYATNPKYPALLIKYIEQYNLQQYSLVALNKSTEPLLVAGDTKPVVPAEASDINTSAAEGFDVPVADAEKISSVNKTKCVFVKKGTSLLLVADNNKISLNKLMEFNDMSEEGILAKDQYIFLHKKQKTGESEFYMSRSGETLRDIAQLTGVQLKYISDYNNLPAAVALKPNTKIFLQPGLMAAALTRVHLVAPKEGLYSIAKTYNVTVDQLREWNKLASDNIMIGQELIISK
ncbi:MAG: glucosaminidase domain-containing protein [Chitinophagaceae bacterium]|nr:glucosaminidase domain-containing protein [Chitinophagaceae bacterium]